MIGTFVRGPLPGWAIALYQVVTLLSYANSAINPVLYAFLTDNFRRTLAEAFQRRSRAATSSVVARGLAMCGNVLHVCNGARERGCEGGKEGKKKEKRDKSGVLKSPKYDVRQCPARRCPAAHHAVSAAARQSVAQ